MDIIKKQIRDSIEVKNKIIANENLLGDIDRCSTVCISAVRNGNKIIFAGNGGSAADAQHLAAELINRFAMERPGIASIALSTDTSVITSISNDYGFRRVFARQIESLGNRGDVLISLSTSGNSENILEGIAEARKKGMTIIGLTGKNGGKMEGLCDILLKMPSEDTPRIQEAHILIGHVLCSLIETGLFAG